MLTKKQTAQNLRIKAYIQEIIEINNDLDFVFFKGASLLLKKIYDLDERVLTDIDILVRPKHYHEFCRRLSDAGYQLYFQERLKSNAVVYKKGEVVVDVHRSIFNFTEFPFRHFPACALIDGMIEYSESHLIRDDLEFVIILLHGLFSLYREERWVEDLIRLNYYVKYEQIVHILHVIGMQKLLGYMDVLMKHKIGAFKLVNIILALADSKISFIFDFIFTAKKHSRAKGYENPLSYFIKIAKDLRNR